VLLPIIIVGSAVLAEASDRLAKRQFDDVEALLHGQSEQARHLAEQDKVIIAMQATQAAILDRLDTRTDGGLQVIADALGKQQEMLTSLILAHGGKRPR
jgi:hypothetical protein